MFYKLLVFFVCFDHDHRTSVVGDLEDPCMIRPGHLLELFFNFHTVATGGVRPTQVFLMKLDRVVIINKMGSRVCFLHFRSLFLTIS